MLSTNSKYTHQWMAVLAHVRHDVLGCVISVIDGVRFLGTAR